MIDLLNLAFPYFSLIFVGFACGKFKQIPESGLEGINFFLLYVSLPALFFRILAKTPFEQLSNPPFVIATTLTTAIGFTLASIVALATGRVQRRQAVVAGLAGGYGNIGYMGPGLALATLGAKAAVPVALIFCFDNVFLFSLVPLLMALLDHDERPLWSTIRYVAKQILFHPLIVASYLGALLAALHLEAPIAIDNTFLFLQNAAAPVALFALGVTVALRPFERVSWEVPAVIAGKLLVQPLVAFGLLTLLGPFDPVWVATALLMASLPPALNVFVIARQYNSWVAPASAAVLVGTFCSVVTLTTMMDLLRINWVGLN